MTVIKVLASAFHGWKADVRDMLSLEHLPDSVWQMFVVTHECFGPRATLACADAKANRTVLVLPPVDPAYVLDSSKPAPGKGRIHINTLLGHVLRGATPSARPEIAFISA
jgi:hypothetical protein